MPADPVVALLPCPFCGGDQATLGWFEGGDVIDAHCGECGCRTSACDTPEDAITTWNTRTPAPAGDVRVDEAQVRAIAADIYAEVAIERLGDLSQRRDQVQTQWFDAVRSALTTHLTTPDSRAVSGSAEVKYLVWSNEHKAWWGADHRGYTRFIERAGRYERAEALKIAGTRDGGWRLNKGNPDEIAIPEQDAIDQYADISREQAKALTEGQQS